MSIDNEDTVRLLGQPELGFVHGINVVKQQAWVRWENGKEGIHHLDLLERVDTRWEEGRFYTRPGLVQPLHVVKVFKSGNALIASETPTGREEFEKLIASDRNLYTEVKS